MLTASMNVTIENNGRYCGDCRFATDTRVIYDRCALFDVDIASQDIFDHVRNIKCIETFGVGGNGGN